MSTPDEQPTAASRSSEVICSVKPKPAPRSVHPCDFRSAGRLSNENARSLTALHESFARRLASALDAYLGTGLAIKLKTLDQLPLKDHIAGLPALSYIVPFTLGAMQSTMILECDLDLVFPIIELLLGGAGTSVTSGREISEIEEEIMQDVASLIARQAEGAWRMPPMSLVANRRIKSALLQQYCPANDKVTTARFEMEIGGATGTFQLVFPTSFIAILIKQIKEDEPQKKTGLRYFPTANIRERIVDCDVVVAASIPRLKVAVKDLITLQPGSVLKLRAPVRNPGMLTAEGMEIFEAMPVRNGGQKAAQLVRRVRPVAWGKELL